MEVILSIIIPVYNAEQYLNACIDSVLQQHFVDFELLLIDDGSSDNSGPICEDYARRDNRVVVVHQHNQGQAAARNRGLEMAKGKYIGFCDNDDILHPEIYQILVGQAESLEADISACSYQVKDMQGNFNHTVHSEESFRFSNREGMTEFLSRERVDIYVWTKIYRRALLEKNHIRFETGRSDEDFLFNHQAFLYAGLTVFVDKALYTYLNRSDSECKTFHCRNLKNYLVNTLYRTNKIEETTRVLYPELLDLAKRQTIFYYVMMIGRVVDAGGYRESIPQFDQIMKYLRKNHRQLITERTYWGMSSLGVWAMLLLPSRLYYLYRRIIFRMK